MLKEDIPPQLLITGYRGVGKTFLLRKVLHDLPESYLCVILDLSEVSQNGKNRLFEEKLLKELLNKINESVEINDSTYPDLKNKFLHALNKIKLKNYNFTSESEIFDIPISVIKDNYEEFSKFVIELPQKIVDLYENIDAFVIVIDEFQLMRYLNVSSAFFCLIQSSTQKQFNVSYIFAGSLSKTAKIIDTINGPNGAFGGRLISYNIEPFTKK